MQKNYWPIYWGGLDGHFHNNILNAVPIKMCDKFDGHCIQNVRKTGEMVVVKTKIFPS